MVSSRVCHIIHYPLFVLSGSEICIDGDFGKPSQGCFPVFSMVNRQSLQICIPYFPSDHRCHTSNTPDLTIQPHGHGSRSEEYRKNIGRISGQGLNTGPQRYSCKHLVWSPGQIWFFTHDLRSNPNSTLQALQVAEGLLGRRGWQGVRTGCRKPGNQQGFNRKPGCYGAMVTACWHSHTIRRVVQIIHLSNPGEKRIRWESDEKQMSLRFTSWIRSAEVASGAKPGVQATGGG